MPTLPALITTLFGLTSLTIGLSTLILPNLSLTHLSLPHSALPLVLGNGLSAVVIGIYYLLAAYQENRAFSALTVPLRVLIACVFWMQGKQWRRVALWEGLEAVCMAGALVWERRRGKGGKME